MSENWLITGGAGYIGSHVVNLAANRGYNVVVLDDLSTGQESFVHPDARLIHGSILDRSAIETALSCFNEDNKKSVVVHLAAKKSPLESQRLPDRYWETNGLGTLNLLLACAQREVSQFIFSSSCSVYGNSLDAVNERTALAPISVYGRTKYVGELLLRDIFSNTKTKFAILRYFNVVGTGIPGVYDSSETNLFPALLKSLTRKEMFVVSGNSYSTDDGTCVRDYIHVSDIARAHLDSSSWIEQTQDSITLNLGSGIGYSVLEILNTFNSYLDSAIKYKFGPARDGDPSAILADISLAKEKFGWEAKSDLNEMVKSVLVQSKLNYAE